MKINTKQIILFVLLDVIVAIIACVLFFGSLDGLFQNLELGRNVLFVLLCALLIQFGFIALKCIQSLLKLDWKAFSGWFVFSVFLGWLIYGVGFVVMLLSGLVGNYLDGF